MNAADSMTLITVVVSVLLVLAVALSTVALRAAVQRSRVRATSSALQRLENLNEAHRDQLVQRPSIDSAFRAAVNSKSKFDRYDLRAFLSTCVLEHEQWFETEIASRSRALGAFHHYRGLVDDLAQRALGTSAHPKVAVERFARVERRLFERARLMEPTPRARIAAAVSYTSPKGRNSYSRRLEWTFSELQQDLLASQQARVRTSSAAAMRARERSLMTVGLRMQILRRDHERCRMCGTSAADGTTLHIDHVLPVSRGGQTVPENLQVLCADCNLGKSNHFVG